MNARMSQALELSWDFVEAASAAQFEALQANAPKAAPCADKGAHRDARRTGVMRDDPSTWDNERWPRGVEGGILPYFGAGQSKCAWYVRGKKAVRDVFAALWRTPDLLVSFDGLIMWRPDPQHRTEHGWFHIDQNPVHKPTKCSVQGLVNLIPATQATGGNVLLRGSHHKFPEHYTRSGTRGFLQGASCGARRRGLVGG